MMLEKLRPFPQRCIGITKSKTLCGNRCKFLFCRHHKTQPLWGIATIIGGIIMGVLGNYTYSLLTDGQRTHSTEQLRKEIQELKEGDAIEDREKMEGVSIWMVLKPEVMTKPRRKFIADVGSVDRSRLSIYLDEKNDLFFRIIDDYGETYPVKLSQKFDYLGKFSLYTFEYGRSDHYSFIKIYLNGVNVAETILDFKVDLSLDAVDWEKMVLGADHYGQNNGKFAVSEYKLYPNTLTKEEKLEQYKYFFTKYFPDKLKN